MFLRKCSEIQEDTDTNTRDTIKKKKKKAVGKAIHVFHENFMKERQM